MAMYDGFPSIHLEGDRSRALALIPTAKALLHKVQGIRANAGISTFSMSQSVGEDASIYVLSALDTHILHISVDVVVPEQVNEEIEDGTGMLPPGFLSGVVINGFLEQREEIVNGEKVFYKVCARFAPTVSCQKTADLRPGLQDSTQLSVTPGPAFDVLRAKSSLIEFSQYTRLRSSMYSGTMRKVAQVVMGLGRINPARLRDPTKKEPDTGYIANVRDYGVQVRYDWRFLRTHGITTASDGSLWLVEISSTQGVLAMRLPIFRNTDTASFLEAAIASGDKAMVTALEDLGCVPTGEAFPTLGRMEDSISSGKVLRLLSAEALRPFYDCSAYSSYMGWAFNSTGSEAHNTAYRFADSGFQEGVWYQLNIAITVPDNAPPYGSAELRKQAASPIYCSPARAGSPARYLPFKVYEPMIGGLLSHEGVGLEITRGVAPPDVDTVLFVMFAGDDLKVVKHYRPASSTGFGVNTDDREGVDCLYEGTWTVTAAGGLTSLLPMMYTNDFDDRRVSAEVSTVTVINSARLGYDPPRVYDFVEAPSTGLVYRALAFRVTSTTTIKKGDRMVAAVVVPEFSREAYYYAMGEEYAEGVSERTDVSYTALPDPNIAFTWRCWPGLSDALPRDRPECNTRVCRGDAPCNTAGVGFPKQRLVVCLGRLETECSDIADSGAWITQCANADNFNQPPPKRISSSKTKYLGTLEKTKLFLVTQGYNGPITLNTTLGHIDNIWMRPSPDAVSGNAQNIQVTHNALGADIVVYNSDIGNYEANTIGFKLVSYSDGMFPTFIGAVTP